MIESYYYILIEIFICFFLTLFLLLYFAKKNTNPVVLITAFISWFLNFVLALFIPFDIYYTQTDEGINLGMPKITENLIVYGYNITYWTLYLFSWIFIPLMQCYESSGELTKSSKLKSSLKANLIYYIVLLSISVIIVVYLICILGIETYEDFLKFFSILKNCSLLYGIVLFFFLLSYSLIIHPKTLYLRLDYKKQVIYHEWRANKFFEKLEETKYDLFKLFNKIMATIVDINNSYKENEDEIEMSRNRTSINITSFIDKKNENLKLSEDLNYTDPYEKTLEFYLDYMNLKFQEFLKDSKLYGIVYKKLKLEKEKPIKDIKELITINYKIHKKMQNNKRMQYRIRKCYYRWALINTIFYFSEEKNSGNNEKDNKEEEKNKENKNKENKNKENKNEENNYKKVKKDEDKKNKKEIIEIKNNGAISLKQEGFIPFDNFSNSVKIFYYLKLKRFFILILFILSIIAGIITIICEVFMIFEIEVFNFIQKHITNILILHLIILSPFVYLISMSIYTLFKIKISSYIYMYGHRQTDSVSLMIFSSYLSRVLFAVCLNVIQAIAQLNDRQKKTKFEEFLGLKMDGDEDNKIILLCRYSPVALIFFLILFLLNIPGKIANKLGFNIFELESEQRDLGVDDGHKYLMTLNKKLKGKKLKKNNMIIFEDS